jgi:hypothetical protein
MMAISNVERRNEKDFGHMILPLAKCERRLAKGFERGQITHFQKPAKTVSAA